MKSRNLLFVAMLSFMLTGSLRSQNKQPSSVSTARYSTYTLSLGLRGGYEGGLTCKYFFSPPKALEFLVSRGWGYGGFRFTGLLEFQNGLAKAKGLDWYYGFGAHIGNYDGGYYGYYGYNNGGYYDKHGNWHPNGYRAHYTTIGIDGIIGLEYQVPSLPLNLSLDLKPFIDLYGWGSHYVDGAFSIRYNIK